MPYYTDEEEDEAMEDTDMEGIPAVANTAEQMPSGLFMAG